MTASDGLDDEPTRLVTGRVASDPAVGDPATGDPTAAATDEDDSTILVEDDPTILVEEDPTVLVEEDPTVIVAAATDAAAAPAEAPALVPLDDESIRRVLRGRVVDREPLAPRPVPPGRHGPLLPGAGPGAVFVTDVRDAPDVPSPERGRTITTAVPVAMPSVAARSRRGALAVLAVVSVSVLVSIVGLVWVIRELLVG